MPPPAKAIPQTMSNTNDPKPILMIATKPTGFVLKLQRVGLKVINMHNLFVPFAPWWE